MSLQTWNQPNSTGYLIYGWLPGWQCKCSIYLFTKSQRAWYKLVIQLSVSLYRISTTSGQRFTITGNNMNIFSYCRHFQYRPYPRTIILRLCHSLPDGKLQKEKRALCFTAGLLWTMAKGEEYSKDSHDAEAILAHYRVDKPSKRFY